MTAAPDLRVVLAVGAASVLLAGCSGSPSVADLRDDVEHRPGVLGVRVDENDGDNDVPLAVVPKHVKVWMEGDASAAEVMDVFDAYAEEVDDGAISGIEVVLEGPKKATLSSGEGIHVSQQMVDDLVEVQQDATITEYLRQAHPVLPGVRIVLAPTGFDEVVAAADRYRDLPDIEDVEVTSARFILIRDSGNEDQRITSAREHLAHRVDSRWGLRGAVVSGRGRLELVVDPADVPAVRRWVAGDGQSAMVGRVVVERFGFADATKG